MITGGDARSVMAISLVWQPDRYAGSAPSAASAGAFDAFRIGLTPELESESDSTAQRQVPTLAHSVQIDNCVSDA
jgi:hypothetical protein